MKLLQINSVVNSGSTGRIAESIGQIVQRHGWQSYIVYGRYANDSSSELIQVGSKWSIYNEVIGTRLLDRHADFMKEPTTKLIRQIEKIKPDIIHLHNIHGYYINYKVLFEYLSSAGIPVVWTLHDCWAFTGHCAYFDFVGCNKWMLGCHRCELKLSYPKSYVDRSDKNYVDKTKSFTSISQMLLVPVSNWLESLLKFSFLKEYPTKVIHNGVDLNLFYPSRTFEALNEKFNLGNKSIVLGVASVWDQRKGLEDFIELGRLLMGSSNQVVLVGLTEKQIKQLPSHIIGIKRTENIDELRDLYSRALVFVNPTYEDNFPTTNLESLACGTPVITYKTGGSVESVSEEVGFVVDKGDIVAVVDRISLIEGNGLGIDIISRCRQRAEKFYNQKDNYEAYMDVYMELLGSKFNS